MNTNKNCSGTHESNVERYMQAIDNNKNISDEYKDELKKLRIFFIENIYLDDAVTTYNLENCQIEVVSKEKLDEVKAAAYYNQVGNKICVDDTNFGLFHETFHMTSDYGNDLVTLSGDNNDILQLFESKNWNVNSCGLYDGIENIGRGLNEGVTSILFQEYFNGSAGGYYSEMIIAKMLCEIIGSDVVLEAYSTGDINLIINALTNIDDDKDQAIKLITAVDRIYIAYLNLGNSYEEYEDSVNETIELLNKYNITKTGNNLDEDQVLNAYCKQLKLENDVTVAKGYFSNLYIVEIGTPYIEERQTSIETVYDDATNNLMEIQVVKVNKILLDQQETLAYQKTKY
jgi:hypothetical protein